MCYRIRWRLLLNMGAGIHKNHKTSNIKHYLLFNSPVCNLVDRIYCAYNIFFDILGSLPPVFNLLYCTEEHAVFEESGGLEQYAIFGFGSLI